jgi:hypothetical protein
MKSTFHHPGGSVIVEPSPTQGFVWVRVKFDDQQTRIAAIPVHLAAVVAQAIEATATCIEEACHHAELPAHALAPAIGSDAEAWMDEANDGGDAAHGFGMALGRLLG